MKNKIICTAAMIVFLIGTAFPQYQISNSVISGGGVTTSNANYSVNSTVGEVFIGKSTNAINQQQSGFWYVYQQQIITAVEDEETMPTEFRLEQNYPNPFNPATKIKFAVPERSNVIVKVYDITGSEVITLINMEMEAGWHSLHFNAIGIASGVYIIRMNAGSYISTKKMMLLR